MKNIKWHNHVYEYMKHKVIPDDFDPYSEIISVRKKNSLDEGDGRERVKSWIMESILKGAWKSCV